MDKANGYAVGGEGIIIATSDGGTSWRVQSTGTAANLASVSFSDPANGHAVGNASTVPVILSTRDRGETWLNQLACNTGSGPTCAGALSTTFPLKGVSFIDANNGFAVGEGEPVLVTTDGGATWREQNSRNAGALYGVAFTDRNNGHAVGFRGSSAAIVATNDGATWSPQSVCRETSPCSGSAPDLIRETLRAVSFVDAATGVAVGDGGRIVMTENGGSTWKPEQSNTNSPLYGVSLVRPGRAWAVGGAGAILVYGPDAAPLVPSPPANLSATPGNRSITATWDAADGRGKAITGYTVAAIGLNFSTSASGSGQVVRDPPIVRNLQGPGTVLTIPDLTNGKRYSIEVSARSDAGEGAPASVASNPGLPWIAIDPMSEARVGATATRLGDGRILVAGGSDAASAEMFNPATGAWAVTGRMIQPRRWHTATLLSNGNVLVTGGVGGAGPVASAELYDTSSGTWKPASPMVSPRMFHTATAVTGGTKVLIAGGVANDPAGSPVARSEIYDVTDDMWRPGPLMAVPRFGHSATLLNGGSVIITGGAADDTNVTTIERYDPAVPDTWRPAGSLLAGRLHAAATLLKDGKILVTGGRDTAAASGSDRRTTEIYDPVGQVSLAGNNLTVGRFRHTATLLPDGRVMAVGGKGDISGELFDPAVPYDASSANSLVGTRSPASVATAPPPRNVTDHVAVGLTDGRVLIAGGSDRQHFDNVFGDGVPTQLAAVLDPASESPTPFPPSPPHIVDIMPRTGPTSGGTRITISGVTFQQIKDVTVGGRSAPFQVVETDTLIVTTPPGNGEADVRVTTTGGTSKATAPAGFSYTDPAGSWSSTPSSMGLARVRSTATTLKDGRALVVGGSQGTGGPLASALLYDPSSRQWSDVPLMAAARSGHSATVLSDGRVLVVGGTGEAGGKPVPLATAEIYDPDSDTWQLVGALSVGRREHTATLLPNGNVLVVGGQGTDANTGATQTLASAELYQPASATWSTTGPLVQARSTHTATALSDGGVLVAGGDGPDGGRVGASERYDASRGRWDLVGGSMFVPRSLHTASLLPDGSVLVAGGSSRTGAADRSERFVPSAARWEPGPRLAIARSNHTATSLENGTVVLVGGTDEGLAEVELYDAPKARFVVGPPLETPRVGHAAALLGSGELLIAGGVRISQGLRVELSSAEVFVATGRFRPEISQVEPRGGPTFGGTTVILRGSNFAPLAEVRFGTQVAVVESSSPTRVAVRAPAHQQGSVPITLLTTDGRTNKIDRGRFTYGSGAWHPGARSETVEGLRRYWHATALLKDGRVLLAGGTNVFPHPPGAVKTVQIYDSATRRWTEAAPMLTARQSHAATTLADGRVMVSGGQTNGEAFRSVEIYDPALDRWTATTPMSVPRVSHTTTLLPDGTVLAVGGSQSDRRNDQQWETAELFDPQKNIWTPVAPMAKGRVNHTATLLRSGKVIVVGGYGSDSPVSSSFPDPLEKSVANSSAEMFDPLTGRWTTVAPLVEGRADHTATLLGDGNLLVAGGTGGSFDGISSAERYDPATNKWTTTQLLNQARGGHGAVLLPNGKVLVAGSGPITVGEPTPGPVSSAEVFDPATNAWTLTSSMAASRGGFSLAPLPDGTVLAAGGYRFYDAARRNNEFAEDPEIYTPAPDVTALSPPAVPVSGGVPVLLAGHGFGGVTSVRFGETEAASFNVSSPVSLTATPPAHTVGGVDVTVTNRGGTSAVGGPARLSYLGFPGFVSDLVADSLAPSEVVLSFTAPDDGSGGAPATTYVVKQLSTMLGESNFDGAPSLCEGGKCVFDRAQRISLTVRDLEPATRYYYALRAVGSDGSLGPLSNVASVQTLSGSACNPLPSAGPGQATYHPGYSLAGLPGGVTLDADGPLYGWADQGARGAYSVHGAKEPLSEGYGYWAYFSCPRIVEIASAGSRSASMPLAAYHASMVGNPSGLSPARVSGHDFAARWDPTLNGGSGGYQISGYREAQIISVGEGLWTFAYEDTSIAIDAIP